MSSKFLEKKKGRGEGGREDIIHFDTYHSETLQCKWSLETKINHLQFFKNETLKGILYFLCIYIKVTNIYIYIINYKPEIFLPLFNFYFHTKLSQI
jgi:hypothetical protein